MSQPAVICYPASFLERPEDRSLLIELDFARIPENSAKLILYRIWADFATGGSDRRPVDPENMEEDRQVRVLENYCAWTGAPGHLVRMAVEAKFLLIELGENPMLVCKGFYPINSAWNAGNRSFQKLGGLSRGLNAQTAIADKDAGRRLELWSRTMRNPFEDIAPEILSSALNFIMRVCRIMNFPQPDDTALQAGVMRMAVESVSNYAEDEIRKTMLWLLSRRKEPGMPDRLDAVLRIWPSYQKSAVEEMSV